jgi:lipopolysaccharide cholinephosphotransferase
METLDEFVRVCNLSGIHYYVGFGSLLGLVRDGCLLPWDYDIDVLVPITEGKALIDALKKNLNEEFYFYCPDIDSKCRHYSIRITKKGFDSSAVHLDVFYLIGSPEEKNKRERFRKSVKKVNFIRKIKLVDSKTEAMGVRVFRIAGRVKKALYFWYPIFMLDQKYKSLCRRYPLESAKYVTTMQAAADTYTKEIFQEPTMITVDGKDYCAPTDIVSFFNQTYKDYKAYPSIASRFNEFYNSIKRIEYFEKHETEQSKMDLQINQY